MWEEYSFVRIALKFERQPTQNDLNGFIYPDLYFSDSKQT